MLKLVTSETKLSAEIDTVKLSTAVPDDTGALQLAVSWPSPPATLKLVGVFKYGATVVVVVLDVDVVVVGAGATVVDVVVVVEVVVVVDVVVVAGRVATGNDVVVASVAAVVVGATVATGNDVVVLMVLARGVTDADSITIGESGL